MSLQDMLEKEFGIRKKEVKEELTPERVAADLPLLRQTISFWRMYPDLFVDYLCTLTPNNSFHFFYYQRVFLRAVMRHKYVYCVFPRERLCASQR